MSVERAEPNVWHVHIEQLADGNARVFPMNQHNKLADSCWGEDLKSDLTHYWQWLKREWLRWNAYRPKNEKQLAYSLQICQMWCDKKNKEAAEKHQTYGALIERLEITQETLSQIEARH